MTVPPATFVMRPRLRILLGLATASVLLAVGVLLAEQHLKGLLVHLVQAHTGRELRIDGDLTVHLLTLQPSVTAERVYIGNPPWMPPGPTAELGKVSLLLRWRLSLPPLAIRRLELGEAQLHLLRDTRKRSNWSMHEHPGGGPPLMESFAMSDARVELHDERHHLEFTGKVTARDGTAEDGASPPFELSGEGRLNGRAATFVIHGDPLARARRDQPYHLTLSEQSGEDQLSGRISLERPFDFRVLEGSFEASGPDLKDAYYLVGLKLIDTGPYRVTGRLQRHGEHFEYQELALHSGGSDLSGTLIVDSSGERPVVTGAVASAQLRTSDLGPRAAEQAAGQSESGESPPWSATKVHWQVLQHADWTLRLRVESLDLGHVTLHTVAARLEIQHGVLTLDKLSGALADGKLSGELRIDASAAVTTERVHLDLAGLQLADLAGSHADTPPASGTLNARLLLQGSGESLKDIVAGANGNVSGVVPHGSVRTIIAAGASLDLAGALGALVHSDKETDVRCAVADFAAGQGVLTARTLVVDTDQALITGSGEVHMDSAALDLTLRGRPKHPRLTLHSVIRVEGSLMHPKVRLSAPAVAAQSAAAVALGAVLTPVAAVLAFVDPGLARDADCADLVAQTNASHGAAP
jgi:AsmA family protein